VVPVFLFTLVNIYNILNNQGYWESYVKVFNI
jgi:hypothetical protein